jgi:ABC-type polysaccharide/polyol phosphate transport system ATPase subunit
MQNSVAVRFEDVSKIYRLGKRRGDTLKETILSSYRRSKGERFAALDRVSFDVTQGEVLGLIGDNGSGKSTILKMVAGITRPTTGRLVTRGRVSALLEVGAGFHPEMTGRENIFLSGAVLGIDENELRERYDDIVAFAELEEFMDTPVKYYSSGMYMRLGFSIAMNVDPDVLLVDEVFAVGDNFFQHKCREYMKRVQESGKTILFVSHDLIMIQLLCSRVILLDHGRIVMDGHPADAVFEYQKRIQEKEIAETGSGFEPSRGFHNRSGTQEACITGIRFLDRDGKPREAFDPGESMTINLDFENFEMDRPATLNFSIRDSDRREIFSTTSRDEGFVIEKLPRRGVLSIRILDLTLMPGVYFLSVGLFDADTDFFAPLPREKIIDIHAFYHSFTVRRRNLKWQAGGIAYLHRQWKLESEGRILLESEVF